MNTNNLLDQINVVGINQISYTMLFDELTTRMVFRSMKKHESLVELFELSCNHSDFKIYGVKYLYVFILTRNLSEAEKLYYFHNPE